MGLGWCHPCLHVTPAGPLNTLQIPDPPPWSSAKWTWHSRAYWAEVEWRPESLHFIPRAWAPRGGVCHVDVGGCTWVRDGLGR